MSETAPSYGTRAVIYARVSTKEQEQEGYSIDAQLGLLRNYASAKAFSVVHEYVDVETASKSGRTSFSEMIEFLRRESERGDTSGCCRVVLVEKTDRLYRNFRDLVTVDDLDLEIHLVKENDVQSQQARSAQKFMHGIRVLVAKNYIDNLSEETRKGMLEKARKGGWPARAPIGYINVERDHKHFIEVDPETACVVRQSFEWYATGGYSLEQLTSRMNKEQLPTISRRSRFSRSSVHRMLVNPLYCGDLLWEGNVYRGTHQPIVDRDLFRRVQQMLSVRGNHRSRHRKHRWAFQGLVHCAHCGCALTVEVKKGKYVYYHCTGYKGKCPEKYVREEALAEQFGQVLEATKLDSGLLEWIVSALKEGHADEKRFHDESIARLQREHQRLQDRIDTMYVDKLDGKVNESFYERKSAEWRAEQEETSRLIEEHRQANRSYLDEGIRIIELCQHAPALYAAQDMLQRRRLLDFVLSNCLWKDGRLLPRFRKPFSYLASLNADHQHHTPSTTPKMARMQQKQPQRESNPCLHLERVMS